MEFESKHPELPLGKFGTKVIRKSSPYLGTATVVGFNMLGFNVRRDGITANPSACYDDGEYSVVVEWDNYPGEQAIGEPDEFEVIGADSFLTVSCLNDRNTVSSHAPHIAKLGGWPSWINPDTLADRIPTEARRAAGLDAGVACALGIIPEGKQRLSAILHAAYTPEAVEQVRRETAGDALDADSETAWWLAMCSVCREGNLDCADYDEQLTRARTLSRQAEERVVAAQQALDLMLTSFDVITEDGVAPFPYGEEDGCIQGAYLAGHEYATHYHEEYGIWFIGTFRESLGLEGFPWSSKVDDQGRPKSGPVYGSRQFVKCATREEFLMALRIVQITFNVEA